MSKNLENIDKLKNINSQSALKEAEERRKNIGIMSCLIATFWIIN